MATTNYQPRLKTKESQLQSPLFGVIPGEVRNQIFAYALVQYEDREEGKAYAEDSYLYRPGFKGPKRSSSNLLQTCQLAWEEAQQVYLEELEWVFWFSKFRLTILKINPTMGLPVLTAPDDPDRGLKGRTGSDACKEFFDNLTPAQVQSLKQVRFFTQMYWLEDGHNLNALMALPNFQPTRLTITIRYSDWWFWETNTPLQMNEKWLRLFKGSRGLRELRVEYETLAWKRAQMDAIVARNKQWRLAVGDGEEGHLSAEGTKLEEWTWTGASRLGGKNWAHHGEGDIMEYVVVTDTWRFVAGPIPEDIQNRQEAAFPSRRRHRVL